MSKTSLAVVLTLLIFGVGNAFAAHNNNSEEVSTLFCANYNDLIRANGFLPGFHETINFIAHPESDSDAVRSQMNRGNAIFVGEVGECNVRPRILASGDEHSYIEDPFACVSGRKDSARFFLPPDQYIVLAAPRGQQGGSMSVSSVLDLALVGEIEIDEFGFARGRGKQKATNISSLITCPKSGDTLLVDVAECAMLVDQSDGTCEAGETCKCTLSDSTVITGTLTDDSGSLAVVFSDLETAVGEVCNYPDQLLFEQSQLDADATLLDYFLHLDNNGLRLLHTRWYPASRLNQCTAQCGDGINNDSDGLTDYPDDPECTDPGDQSEYLAGRQ